MKYLISHQGEELGPLTAEEIVRMISARSLDVLDYAFDDVKQDWVVLTELTAVTALLQARKPAAPPKPPTQRPTPPTTSADSAGAEAGTQDTAAHDIVAWYVLKGESKFGPFPHAEMVGLLQQKIVYPFDYCWHAGLDQWTRVVDLAPFRPERIRELLARDASAFIARRFERLAYGADVIVHDNVRTWRGRGRELSGGGLGVRLGGAGQIVPGQTLHVHCAAHGDLPAFNATCEVVAIAPADDGQAVDYGLRFVSLGQDARASINHKVA